MQDDLTAARKAARNAEDAAAIAWAQDRIVELERKLARQETLAMVYQAIGRQELGDEFFEETARKRIADLET